MISIITATYNRGNVIGKLYNSLKSQTNKDFEWMIIDDGSTDNTSSLFDMWKKEDNKFLIDYEYSENGGKHRALNRVIQKVRSDFCFIVDSDDYLTNDAVEKIHQWIKTINDQEIFAGVSGLRQDSNGIIIGQYPKYKEYIDASNFEREKKHLLGDKAEVYRTDLLKKHPFPEFENEYFVTEAVCWNAIAAEGYKIRWFNQPICVCEYLEDGLTKSGANSIYGHINNFKGYSYYVSQSLQIVPRQEAMPIFKDYNDTCRYAKMTIEERAHILKINKLTYYKYLCIIMPAIYMIRILKKVGDIFRNEK